MIRILVTGSYGQLGKSIQEIAPSYKNLFFTFTSTATLNITDQEQVNAVFDADSFDYCINCAAFTEVETAEQFPEKAFAVNAIGVRNLALACKTKDVVLIHISTDYVFDGRKGEPYTSKDVTNPINQYGKSKLAGEEEIQKILTDYLIVRTSWLYSDFGKNFYKTILQKAKIESELYVTDAQTGCPTHARNLAKYILSMLLKPDVIQFGISHFTDREVMTWYDFANRILEENGLVGKVALKKAKNYRTFAERPVYSVLI